VIILPLNLWSIPLLFLIWICDSIAFLVLARLLLQRLPLAKTNGIVSSLQQLTDPMTRIVTKCFPLKQVQPKPWVIWLIILICLSAGRSVLLALIL